MSNYDLLRKRLNRLELLNGSVKLIPTFILITLGVINAWDRLTFWPILSLCSIGLLVLPTVFRFVFKQVFPSYKRLLAELHRIESEVSQLRSSVQAIYDKYRERNKGERFKRTYELVGKSINE